MLQAVHPRTAAHGRKTVAAPTGWVVAAPGTTRPGACVPRLATGTFLAPGSSASEPAAPGLSNPMILLPFGLFRSGRHGDLSEQKAQGWSRVRSRRSRRSTQDLTSAGADDWQKISLGKGESRGGLPPLVARKIYTKAQNNGQRNNGVSDNGVRTKLLIL